MTEEDNLTDEDKAFLEECRARNVSDEFLQEWLDYYFIALDKGAPLPAMPWDYLPIGKLLWTPKFNRTPKPISDDDREEILLLLQYQ